MLSVNNCRKLLGVESDTLSDEEIEALREQFHCLASLVITQYVKTQRLAKSKSNVLGFRTALNAFIEGESDSIEERAAIIEFDHSVV